MTTTADWTEELYAYLYEKAEAVARTVHRSYPMIDTDDLVQEALVWAVQHPGVLEAYLESDDGIPKLMGAMKNACRDYAVAQRAYQRGDEYRIDDAWYPLDALKGTGASAGKRGLLHYVFDDEAWTNPEKGESEGRTKRDPAEGNNWLATLADVSSGLDKLSRSDPRAWALLVLHYKQGYTYQEIGDSMDPVVAKQTISDRMSRAVKKLQEILGGPRPKKDPEEDGWENGLVGTRRAISNAHARAITDAGYAE